MTASLLLLLLLLWPTLISYCFLWLALLMELMLTMMKKK